MLAGTKGAGLLHHLALQQFAIKGIENLTFGGKTTVNTGTITVEDVRDGSLGFKGISPTSLDLSITKATAKDIVWTKK